MADALSLALGAHCVVALTRRLQRSASTFRAPRRTKTPAGARSDVAVAHERSRERCFLCSGPKVDIIQSNQLTSDQIKSNRSSAKGLVQPDSRCVGTGAAAKRSSAPRAHTRSVCSRASDRTAARAGTPAHLTAAPAAKRRPAVDQAPRRIFYVSLAFTRFCVARTECRESSGGRHPLRACGDCATAVCAVRGPSVRLRPCASGPSCAPGARATACHSRRFGQVTRAQTNHRNFRGLVVWSLEYPFLQAALACGIARRASLCVWWERAQQEPIRVAVKVSGKRVKP